MNQKKLITCILPKGIAAGVSKKLLEEKGIVTGNIGTARGTGHITPKKHRGVAYESEKEIFTVVIDSEQSDAIFEYIYEIAEIDRPHGGLMYMNALHKSSEFVLPEEPLE